MKARIVNSIFVFAAGIVIAMWSASAYAICQSCPGMGSLQGDCYTITDPCQYHTATMGACVRVPHYNENGELIYYTCDGLGSQPGPECAQGCGGDHGDGGGGSGGGSGCTLTGGQCPPECMSCSDDLDI